jgi:uncharacterized protein (DUF433 family)
MIDQLCKVPSRLGLLYEPNDEGQRPEELAADLGQLKAKTVLQSLACKVHDYKKV